MVCCSNFEEVVVVRMKKVVNLQVKKIMVYPLHHLPLNQFITELALMELLCFVAVLQERMNFMQIAEQNL